MSGISTPNLPMSSLIDTLVGSYQGRTHNISVDRLVSLVSALLGPSYATRAQLFADLNWPSGAVGYVRGDATSGFNGVYRKNGAYGAGNWVRVGDLPSGAVETALIDQLAAAVSQVGLIELQNVAGTANAVTAEIYAPLVSAGLSVAALPKIVLTPASDNTGAATLLITGDERRAIQRFDGSALRAGDLRAGEPVILRRILGVWRILGVSRGDMADKADAVNSGPVYASRQAAVDAGQAALLPAIGRIVTLEGTAVVYRGPGSTVDPLFGVYPQWGVSSRVETAAAIRNSGVLPLVNVAGSGDAITADLHQSMLDAGVTALSALSEVEYIPALTNAAANPKITIAGSEYEIRGPDGAAWPAQGFVVGRTYKLRRRVAVLRVVSGDVSAPDIQAGFSAAGVIGLTGVGGSGDEITASWPAGLAAQPNFAADKQFRFQPLYGNATTTPAITVLIAPGQPGIRRILRDSDLGPLPVGFLKPDRVYTFVTHGAQFARLVSNPANEAERNEWRAGVDQERADRQAAIALIEEGEQLEDGSYRVLALRDRASGAIIGDLMRLHPDQGLVIAGSGGGYLPAGKRGIGGVDRYDTVNGRRYPVAMVDGASRKAIIVSVYGQSNADATEMDDPLIWTSPPMPHHILMLDDVNGARGGLRGYVGVAAPGTSTLIPAREDAVVVNGHYIQSYATAAAARLNAMADGPFRVFAVRSSAVGGQRLVGAAAGQGIWKDSAGAYVRSWLNWTQDIRNMRDGLVALGYEVEAVHICFTHQEADWQTARATYASQFGDMKAEREALLATDLPGIPVRWFVDQACGSGLRTGMYLGGAWQSRLAIVDAVAAAANMTMVMPRYTLRYGRNGGALEDVHHAHYDRILQGETYAHAMQAVMAGRAWAPPRMAGATVSGNSITVTFDSLSPIRVDPGICKVRSDMGFKVGDGTITVQSVTQTGQRQITLQCSASPAGQTLAYAWRQQDAQDVSDEWPISTGAIRDAWEAPSMFLPGERIIRAALGGTIQL